MKVFEGVFYLPKKRILSFQEHPIYTSGIFTGLQDLGHEVRIKDLKNDPFEDHRKLIVNEINEFKPDFVFNPGWCHDRIHLDSMFDVLKEKGLAHIYWATEDPTFYELASLPLARRSDFVFTTTMELLPSYRRLGIPSEYLQFGVNPKLHKPWPKQTEYTADIILVAHNYVLKGYNEWLPFRLQSTKILVEPLTDGIYDIKIWGLWWTDPKALIVIPERFHGGELDYYEMPKANSSAKIVLGSQFDNTSKTQTSCRAFEVLGSRAFHLTIYTPATERLFQNHKHLVWSKSPEETKELVDYYLKNDFKREKIALQGQQEVYHKHTYRQRADYMMLCLKNLRGFQ